MLHINLLGTPELFLDDQLQLRFRTRKAQALLIYLATTNRKWTRGALATLFWPETRDATALKNLRDILPPLRRQVEEYLLIEDDTIALDSAAHYKCDVQDFRTVLEKEFQHIETDLLAATLERYRGEFLQGFATARISADFELWALREREQLHQLALMGFTTLCQRQQENGALEAALMTNRELLRLVPWDEASHRRQMLLLAQGGQQAAALAHFDICRQMLADELDAEPDAETITLHEQIRAGHIYAATPAPVASPALAAPEAQPVPHNLPRPLTSLIGRASDVDAVLQLLQEESTALLTLVGQGGVGKTRLALAVAQQARQTAPALFPDGIWFVPLVGIAAGEHATEELAGAIVHALGLSLSGSDPLSRQLLRALATQKLLLVLDNLEHLVAERSFLLEVVQNAQQVKILMTSREQLRLHAEHLYPVVGLSVPAAHEWARDPERGASHGSGRERSRAPHPPQDLGQYASVELFVTWIQQRLPEFQLTLQNQPNIGRICQLLGGVPLGLELTAQLYVEQGAAILPPLIDEIERLDPLQPAARGFDHLQRPALDLPARHQSLRSLLHHSWRLLGASERELLRHCAIFRGGFTREAILAVSNGDGSTLLALVTKSLVRRASHDRYDLPELVREYVIDQLQQDVQMVRSVAQKHAAYFAKLVAQQEERIYQQSEALQMLQREIYNLRAMWHWLIEQAPTTQAAVALLNHAISSFFQFFALTSQRTEALMLARNALESLRPALQNRAQGAEATRLLALLLVNAAEAGVRTEERMRVKEWVAEANAIGAAQADAVLLTQSYLALAIIDARGPNHHRALFDDALTWAERAHSPVWQVHVLLAAIPHWVTSLETRAKATDRCEALIRIVNTQQYQHLLGDALLMQAMVYRSHEEYERSIETVQKSLEACQSGQGRTPIVRMCHEMLGQIYMQIRKLAEAHNWAHAAYRQSKIEGNQPSVLNNLYTMGFVKIQQKDWPVAANYLHELITSAEEIDATQFTILGYMGLGMLHNHQQRYENGISYYQKAAELSKQANYPGNWAASLSGIANAYLYLKRYAEAYKAIVPLLVDDLLFSFPNRSTLNLAAITYRVLTARQDSRAAEILERVHAVLQSELAKFTDPELRAAFIENDSSIQNILRWWAAKQDTASVLEQQYHRQGADGPLAS